MSLTKRTIGIISKISVTLTSGNEIWFATNMEIYDYVQAYKSLQYSANGKMVYNPTWIPVWLDVDCKLYCINPNETIYIEE